ncbi:MAG: PAS domain-containing protein, partial [Thermoanaerobaculia bacterium]
STIEQDETSNEELKASNEDLQASNEELRSATEELETSKEELQSVNEELSTVNYELKTKLDELSKSNDDLQNFIGAADIAILFVDAGLRIKRFTPRTTDIFNILPGDIGRSLLDITSKLEYPDLGADAASVFDSLQPIEREVRSITGRRYVARALPYRTVENHIDGAALSFVDITNLRRTEQQLRLSEDHLRLAVRAARDLAVIVLDDDARITAWNGGAECVFGYSEQEMLGESLTKIFVAEDIEAHASEHDLAKAAEAGHVEESRWYRAKSGERVYCSGVLSRIESPEMHGYVKITHIATQAEIGEMRNDRPEHSSSHSRAEAESASALKDDFLAVISHELKNPLNLISVNADLLARQPEMRSSSQTGTALEMIRHAIRGQSKIIDDLLDISRIRTGKLM